MVASSGQSRAWVIEQAITAYTERQSRQIQVISEALADYRGGGAIIIPHDRAMARLASRRSPE